MITPVSFEFFPPNTEQGMAKLKVVRAELGADAPEFFSVTYGAGGVTQAKTLSVVLEIAAEGLMVAPHLTCVGASRETLRDLLTTYRQKGIRRLVALRGDLPSGVVQAGELRYASDLVKFVREETGDWFHIEVAAYPEVHPQAKSPASDLDAFELKVKNGADSAMTQYFYNTDAFFRFRDEAVARGINVPLVPGIMPITNFTQLARFSDACGAEIPRWMRSRLASFGDDVASIKAFGLDVVAQQCRRLIAGGVPGLHFYTLNQAGPSREILARVRG